MPRPERTFPFHQLDRLEPADQESADAFDRLTWISDCLAVLAHREQTIRQPAPGPEQPVLFDSTTVEVPVTLTAAILYDTSAIYGGPGVADLVAAHLHRNPSAGTFRLRAERVPTPALAKRWLAGQGVDPTALTEVTRRRRVTDRASLAAEQRIAGDLSGRYEVIDHYTHENGPVYVLYRDRQPGVLAPYLPHAEIPEPADSPLDYRVREARFDTPADAARWHLDDFPSTAAVVTVHPAATSARSGTAPARRRPRR
ncbi:hypothetical protein [Streptacidiphilus fuscans]|uniref:Uncharacterized protein n=1 Tax=Streptacidiphilus fuscans TaxID=2789292 RepID=A0A931B956_9ACTN|nr:hypothetical protein [Streptacidiphilus fuscans]MBF9071797.1 hypothetical protein [Streptacidiphilus fuscans]